MTPKDRFDVLVLGGGSGGYSCALRAAQLGLSVLLIEQEKVGGTCLHHGCIPTKALLHAAEIADAAQMGPSFGVRTSFDGVDLQAVVAYQDAVVKRLWSGLNSLLAVRGVSVVHGTGTLIDANRIDVDGRQFYGHSLVLATGAETRSLPDLDLDGERTLGSEHALRLESLPRSAVIIGGGVIGSEFASAWCSFGVEVTLVEARAEILPGEESAVSKSVKRSFEKRGISVLTDTSYVGHRSTSGGVQVEFSDGREVVADVVLVAVGRTPRTSGLGIESCGILLDDGFVKTDERLRTSIPHVFAIGDIVRGPQLAHRGFAHGLFAAEEIAGLNPVPVNDALIPRVTFSEPEVASVGYTEAEAVRDFGDDSVQCVSYDLAGNGKSQILKGSGFVKLVGLRDGPILGAHIVGHRAGELIAEVQLAVGWEAVAEDVARLVHAHPTQGEAIGEAFLALAGKALHAHT